MEKKDKEIIKFMVLEKEKKELFRLIKKYNPDFTYDNLIEIIELSPVNVFMSIKAEGPIKKGYPEKRKICPAWDKISRKDAAKMQELLMNITRKLWRCRYCNRIGTYRYGFHFYCSKHKQIPIDLTFQKAVKNSMKKRKTKNKLKKKMPKSQRLKISKSLKKYYKNKSKK
jgi:hypothetical protein